nr:MAG TPA: hypothetical protein [Caudoviricetes sp.]
MQKYLVCSTGRNSKKEKKTENNWQKACVITKRLLYLQCQLKKSTMKPKTKERREYEKRLLFYLELYNELKDRDRVEQTLLFFEEEIDKLVELLKRM